MFEGFDHLLFSGISITGMIAHHVTSFYAWLTPSADVVFGFASLTTGFVMRQMTKRKQRKEGSHGE